PVYPATASTPGSGSTAAAAAARRQLQAKQASRVLTEDLRLLALVQVPARADGRDGVRIFRIEMGIVARHQDVVLAEIGDRPHEVAFVRLAGDVAVALDVLGGRHLH